MFHGKSSGRPFCSRNLTVRRFLPQGGTWDVADVQWNPHMSHIEYIVSTSSEKLCVIIDETSTRCPTHGSTVTA